MNPSSFSHFLTAGEGAQDGALVGILQVAAHGEAAGKAGDLDAKGLKLLVEVEGGGIAFHAGIGGDDDLLDPASFDPLDELADLEVIGADAFDG